MQEGDRIAQLIIEKIATPDVVAVDVSRLVFLFSVGRCSPSFFTRDCFDPSRYDIRRTELGRDVARSRRVWVYRRAHWVGDASYDGRVEYEKRSVLSDAGHKREFV